MSTIKIDTPYKCDNDCKISGCPGHILHAEYQSTSDIYSFHIDDNKEALFYSDRNKMVAILSAIHEFAFRRVEVEYDIKNSKIKES